MLTKMLILRMKSYTSIFFTNGALKCMLFQKILEALCNMLRLEHVLDTSASDSFRKC